MDALIIGKSFFSVIKEDSILVLLFLYFINLLLDYPLQGEYLANNKGKSNYLLFVHSAIWGIGISLALIPLDLYIIWKPLMLIFGHMLIDAFKSKGWFRKMGLKEKTALYADQFLHLFQIILCFTLVE